MSKKITPSQLIGEIGEAAARSRFLSMGFQFDCRSRLEAGIDGIAEVMVNGKPLGKMIAVQVKATSASRYANENEAGFTYLLNTADLAYWRTANLPVIIVLYRQSDESFYWKKINVEFGVEHRKLTFSKSFDRLDKEAADTIAQLTVSKTGPGYYVPPLGGGEEAVVNMLPITLPNEIYVASTPYSPKQAMSVLFNGPDTPRFDWTIKGGAFWSFHDPREECTSQIVDLDQVDAIDTSDIAQHEDIEEQYNFSFLLKQTLRHQFRNSLDWDKGNKVLYFRAEAENTPRTFKYLSTKSRTETEVVNVVKNKKAPEKVAFVRHHAFAPRFERMLDKWFLIVSPTYHFTTNGFVPHSYPAALLSGKKRLDNNASLRGQVIMWYRFLSSSDASDEDLFSFNDKATELIHFSAPPKVSLPTTVPERAWSSASPKMIEESSQENDQGGFDFD